jgi:Rrf2 family protein
MLRISKKADYAVFLLGAIARQGAYPGGPAGDAVVSAQEISRQAGLNKSVVANLLKEFARHGLLESVRGLRGGYRLGKVPSEISLADILEVVEGRFSLVDCIEDSPPAAGSKLLPLARSAASGHGNHDCCSLISFCPSKNPMRVVHDRVLRLFEQIRLDELCSLPARTPSPAHASGPAPAGTRR